MFFVRPCGSADRRSFVFGCFLTLLFAHGCTVGKDGVPVNAIELSEEAPVVQVKNWKITDAFLQDSTVAGNPIDANFLFSLRANESDLTVRDLADRKIGGSVVENTDVGIRMDRLFGKDAHAAVYLYCELESKTGQEANLLFSGIQESKIWMNNRFVYQSSWRNAQSKHYQEYVPVELKKGKNLLLVKVALSDRKAAGARWTFNMFVANKAYARESFLKDYRFTILDQAVTKDSARLYLGPYANSDISVKVVDMSDADVIPWRTLTKNDNREARSGLRAMALEGINRDSLYSILVGLGKDTLRQDFIFGDYANVLTRLKTACQEAKRKHGFRPSEDFTTAYERLDYLAPKSNQPASRPSDKSHWDLSRVLFAKEVWTYLDGYPERTGGRPFSGIISGYVSAIDSSRQYYLSHIPERLLKKGGKIPLLFIMPFTYSHQKLLETWGISNLDQMWLEAKMAADNGFGIVWADLRGHPGVNEISVTAFQEILASLENRFVPDRSRLFLLGNSASSVKAMSLATRLPSVFAATVFVNPDMSLLSASKTYANMANLTNQRVFIQHSSKDEIIPIRKVEDFHRDLRNNGVDAHFIKVDIGTHFVAPKDTYREVFSRLKDVRRKEPGRSAIAGTELKYAESCGIRVMEKSNDGDFKIDAARRGDTLIIEQHNVRRFEIDLSPFGYPASFPHVRLNEEGFRFNKKAGKGNVLAFNRDARPDFRKNNRTEGPINHVFAGAFKVIYNDSGENIKDLLDEQWKSMYFSPIPAVREEDFRKETYEKNHLIVIGSSWKDGSLKRIVNGLPIKLERDSVMFRGKKHGRRNLMIAFVHPNPLNPEKYVYFIATDKTVKELFLRDFTNAYWYDYELYSTAQNDPVPIDIGSFNNLWE